MFKSKFFRFILRIINWMDNRRQEIYFIIMGFFTLSAIVIGIDRFIYYRNRPMFQNPSSLLEHFAQPIFIGLLTITLVLLFGIFFAHFLIMVPFKRLKINRMELEFDSKALREQQIANQFLYSSTMLHNHTENVRYLIDNQLLDLKQVLRFLAGSYKNYALRYNNELTLEIDIIDPTELKGRERKLFQVIDEQNVIKSNTAYDNRLVNRDNLLVGIADVGEPSDKVAVVVRRGYDFPFDTYDQETLESIIGYAVILFDTAIMIELFQEDGIFTEDPDTETD